MPGSADRPPALGHKHLDFLPILFRNDRGHRIWDDDPIRLRRLDHLGLAGLPPTLFGPAVLEPEELRLGPAVPYKAAAIRRVLKNRLDRREVPMVLTGRGNAAGIQVGGDGGEAHAVQAHAEDVLDDLHALRVGEHQPRPALFARLLQRLPLGVAGLELAVLVVDLAHAAGTEADAEHDRAVWRSDLAVVAERRSAAGVRFRHHRAELAAQRILRQRNRELTILELSDRSQHIAVDSVAAQEVLGDRQHHHAGLAKKVAVVFRFSDVATREPVRVPDDHRLELATLRVGDHVLKGRALVRRSPAD
ncbi:MAG: hypothetical protein L6R00_19955 [Phycisphaerae bacterium]|nr:hypothetical protein [Phycisphaerae bacterium]